MNLCQSRRNGVLTVVVTALLLFGEIAPTGIENTAAAQNVADSREKKPMFTESGHSIDDLQLVKKRVLAKEAILLDVREQDEWSAGHLKSAQLVPLSELKGGVIPEKYARLLSKEKPIYLHCRSGGRVLTCAEILTGKGYDIRPLKAGYEKLLQEGFERADDDKQP